MMILDCIFTGPNEKPMFILINFFKIALQIIQIVIPVGIIVLGSIDLGKAVVANDEKAIKKAQSTLAKRFVAAIITFLVALIVYIALGVVGDENWKDCWKNPQYVEVNTP